MQPFELYKLGLDIFMSYVQYHSCRICSVLAFSIQRLKWQALLALGSNNVGICADSV